MKLGVVSDVHGNLPALQAVVADAGAVDGWINLGDIVSGPLWPAETAAWLMARGWPTLAGNHERQLLDTPPASATDAFAAARLSAAQRDWLAALPKGLAPRPGLHCVHGTPLSDVHYLLETVTPDGLRAATTDEVTARLSGSDIDCGLLPCGHSHLPRDVTVGTLRIVNPGSVGLPAYDDDHPWFHVVETASPHARYALIGHGAGGWQVQLRTVAYAWEAAAARAEANGRGDWADALRSGRVGRTEAMIAGPGAA